MMEEVEGWFKWQSVVHGDTGKTIEHLILKIIFLNETICILKHKRRQKGRS